ncbi:MAG: glycerophosphodiester phosphodiesterase family protein [Steroidobacteraceae bacterium]
MSAPVLIAHRGASGYFPEHTLPAYALAILQGADFIEPDLVATRDGVLVARHENEIGGTTDVAQHEEFAARRRTQRIDGGLVEGWFTEDFTWEELQRLRARERIASLRPHSAAHDGLFCIPSFAQILGFLAAINEVRSKAGQTPVGVYPETKHPSHFAALGLPLEPVLLAQLATLGGAAPVFIQSFEVGNLMRLHRECAFALVQLMSPEGGPWDRSSGAEAVSYRQMCTAQGLAEVARYAQAIGVHKAMVLEEASGEPTGLVARAHAAGLAVHVWTFRAENHFLEPRLRRGANPAEQGDLEGEVRSFVAAGIDGLFADQPDLVRTVLSGN